MIRQRKMKFFGQMSCQRWRDASLRGLPGAVPNAVPINGIFQ
jgi:hypothetical protein